MPLVEVSDHAGVWVVAFARPPVNAVDLSLVRVLRDTVAEAAESSRCRAVVLTGNPPAFCAGVDVKVVPQYEPAALREMIRSINWTIRHLYGLPKPTVAAVNGHAIGAGLVVALACDFRLVAEGPHRLGLTEITAGIPYPACPMVVVQSELDRNTARQLTLGGFTFGPGDAVTAKFADQVLPPERLLPAAIERAAAAAELSAYGTVKRQFKAQALQRIDAIVERDDDPMLQHWV